MAQDQNIIQDAIDRDVDNGTLTPITNSTADRRTVSRSQGTYDVYIEIDIDCEELLDATGLDYECAEDDDTQNEVLISLTPSEATDVLDQSVLSLTNEQTLAACVLNHELSEYTTKATIYTPHGDIIIFK